MAYKNPDGSNSVIVERGDCMWNIARDYLGNGRRWPELADLNGINKSKPIIYVGNVIRLDVSGSPAPAKPAMQKPTIEYFALQAGTERDMFAAWTWSRENTAQFRVMWYYLINGYWVVGSDSETKDASEDYRTSAYSAPENATKVRFKVLPISETHGENDTVYWTADWSSYEGDVKAIYDFSDNPPTTPDVVDPVIENNKLTVEFNNLDLNATDLHIRVVKDNSIIYHGSPLIPIKNLSGGDYGYASYQCNVDAGSVYKIAVRSYRDGDYSPWSEYSNNVGTAPSTPTGTIKCLAKSETSVYLEWNAVQTAETYDIEYTTDVNYFDGSNETTTETGVETTHYTLTGLESGDEYFFRIRAVNEDGESGWSDIVSVAIGTTPIAPTTWSSTTTAIIGEELNLYWVHNSEDNSTETYATLELNIGGVTETYTLAVDEDYSNGTISYVAPGEDDAEGATFCCSVDTSNYVEGTKIQWRVCTAGATKVFGDWSIQRTVDIYAPPTLALTITNQSKETFDYLTGFPFYVDALAGPKTQAPIGYHLSVTANEMYESVDDIGHAKIVSAGDEVYSKYFDISSALAVEFSANNIDLKNNINYTVKCTVTMNSGLTAEAESSFTVAWQAVGYIPNAEIGIDKDSISAYIRPYCIDENGDLVSDLTLSVYRREFDGSFKEIATGLDNAKLTFVTDPHPALDYARYRIVSKTNSTGTVEYYDIPGYYVGEKAIILQWNEVWSSFDLYGNDEVLAEKPWSGSLLRLPYNVDVSDSYSPDKTLVNYVGRQRPVSYYGTHLGETSTWNVTIDKKDTETLYALRRLAIWTGDVYVREPSGGGYWANLTVSFSQKHLDLTIPVTLTITRVEGGV